MPERLFACVGIILLIVGDVALGLTLFYLSLPIGGIALCGVLFLLLTVPLSVHLLPRHCVVCNRRTRRYISIIDHMKELLCLGGAKPHCSLHLQ